MGVDTGANRRASQAQLAETVGGVGDVGPRFCHGTAVRCELLAQADGHGILHVGAPRFHDPVKFGGLRCERLLQCIEDRVKGLQRQQRGQAHAARKNIVRRLTIVNVVVRMDLFVGAER